MQPKYVAVDANGNPDLLDLEKILSGLNEKVLVSLMHINNEIGNILDLPTVAALCESYGAYFHSDTVQSIGHFPWDLQKIKIHFLGPCCLHVCQCVSLCDHEKNTIRGASSKRWPHSSH